LAFEVPNLTLLRQFIVTAEERGISKAAKRLRISQPALSKNIHKLEDLLQTRLFERHSGGADLTETGRIFLERAQIIALEYQHALQDIRNILADQDATIRIAAGPIWSSTVLPHVAERFHALFPRHRLRVRTDSIWDLTDDLRLGRVDIFAGALVNRTKPPGFTARKLATADLVVFASKDHPLVQRGGKVPLDCLADYPFVAFEPSFEIIEFFSKTLREHHARPLRVMLETSSIYACVQLALTGKYLFYETSLIGKGPIGEGLAVVPLEVSPMSFDIGIVYRDGLDRIPHFNRLMQIMSDVLQTRIFS
jgi:DNA-binding transcriptional LysR family regulator